MNKWIVALGIFLVCAGSPFLYFGLPAYLHPEARGQLLGGGAWTIFGSLLIIIGFILVIKGYISKPKTETLLEERRNQ